MSEMQNLFVDANEKEVATLGGSYLRNFLATGSLSNGFCAVSDKRVYFRGKCYHKTNGHYKSSTEERTVDLKDVTGTGFVESRDFVLMILAILSVVWFAFCILTIFLDADEPILMILLGALPCIAFCVTYFLRKTRLFEISFAGGKIAFKASNYDEKEMQNFQKELRKAKDNYSVAPQSVVSGSNADELKKYKELLDTGAITQEEYDNAKKRILG